jgi:hypothetical protein
VKWQKAFLLCPLTGYFAFSPYSLSIDRSQNGVLANFFLADVVAAVNGTLTHPIGA